jgi:peptidoglycan/xylan/chitin deacetylase (PgdA/CDA1 family)
MVPVHDPRAALARAAAVVVAFVLTLGFGVVVLAQGFDSSADRASPRPAAATGLVRAPTASTTLRPTSTTTAGPVPVAIDAGPVAPVLSKIPTTDPVVFFTIDDGLVQDSAVLDYLRAHHIPVTLFPVPSFVHQNVAYFQAIHALGASAQDHTLTHPDLRHLSAASQQREICGPLDDYAQVFGARPWLFRPPYGALSPSTAAIARSCGIRAIVTWRATMNDGVLRTQGGPLQPGDIILMHFRTDLRHNLEVALNAARAAGLRPARLEQYLTPMPTG